MATEKTVKKTTEKTTAKKTAPAVAKKASKKVPNGAYAVIATGGKQYRVSEGDTVTIEKLAGTHAKGDKVSFDNVLLVDTGAALTIGEPFISGASVVGEVASVGRDAKITVIKYKQKSRYFKKNGHRQPHLKVTITSIK